MYNGFDSGQHHNSCTYTNFGPDKFWQKKSNFSIVHRLFFINSFTTIQQLESLNHIKFYMVLQSCNGVIIYGTPRSS